MYHGTGTPRSARSLADNAAASTPVAVAGLALGRVRKLLDAYVPAMTFDAQRLQNDLAISLEDAGSERERLFARGWLAWIVGDFPTAQPRLAEAVARAEQDRAMEVLAQAAYWRARVQLRLGRPEALPSFEGVLRQLAGSPQAAVWLVDLLGRSGRLDRAEQVWKSLRSNRRAAACPEVPLLHARFHLRRGELTPAERTLQELTPTNGVIWVERLLLLAWLRTAQKRGSEALACLAEARQGPYPPAALAEWSAQIEHRLGGDTAPDELCRSSPVLFGSGSRETTDTAHGSLTTSATDPADLGRQHALDAATAPPALRDYLAGQQARQSGASEASLSHYQNALDSAVAQPFARYALVSLGKEDPAALLASSPGLFLAARCRARITLDQFRRRQAAPAEMIEAARQAEALDYHSPRLEHFRRLGLALQQRSVSADELAVLAGESANGMRAAVELAVRCLPPEAQRTLLLGWADSPLVSRDEGLRILVGRQLLRLLLLGQQVDAEMSEAVGRLLPGEPLLGLVMSSASASGGCKPPDSLLACENQGADAPRSPDTAPEALVQLAQASYLLAEGLSDDQKEPWRRWVHRLRGPGPLKGWAQALLLQEAAERHDAPAVAALLEERDAWRGMGPVPPAFVLRAVEHIALTQPVSSAWRRSLARWLEMWEQGPLLAGAESLMVVAGLTPLSGETAQAPPGMPLTPWLLHQAARALGREDARTANALLRRGLVLEPENELARSAWPELERRSRAEALAALLANTSDAGAAAAQLADLVDLLETVSEGHAALAAAERGELQEAWDQLEALAGREDLPARLAHHLALLLGRKAIAAEQHDSPEAVPSWRLSWRCWLHHLAQEENAAGRRVLLDWLLAHQRQRINDLLSRNAVEPARSHWQLVQQLPELPANALVQQDLAQRVTAFRDELATEYLVATREVMRYGAIPEGWRADYDRGLAYLRRLLSLDGDNLRLLSVLIEICTDWLFDLSVTGELSLLRQQLERFTPFAHRLARLVEDQAGQLSARAALAEFWKIRGLLTADRQQKRALYQEALRFNPANGEAARLLAELEPPAAQEQEP
jgi:hypothetical protein